MTLKEQWKWRLMRRLPLPQADRRPDPQRDGSGHHRVLKDTTTGEHMVKTLKASLSS